MLQTAFSPVFNLSVCGIRFFSVRKLAFLVDGHDIFVAMAMKQQMTDAMHEEWDLVGFEWVGFGLATTLYFWSVSNECT